MKYQCKICGFIHKLNKLNESKSTDKQYILYCDCSYSLRFYYENNFFLKLTESVYYKEYTFLQDFINPQFWLYRNYDNKYILTEHKNINLWGIPAVENLISKYKKFNVLK